MSKVRDLAHALHDEWNGVGGWSSLTDDEVERWEWMARTAINSLMEPNNKMLHEAAKAMSPGRRPTPDRVSVNEKHKIRYQAMIREALK